MRMVPCNVLLSSRTFKPDIDMQAEESIEWTAEGRERLQKIPGFVRPMATSAILRYAIERGHSMITSSVITEAVENILPAGAMQAMRQIGEKIRDDGVDPESDNVLKDYKQQMLDAHAGEDADKNASSEKDAGNGDAGNVEVSAEHIAVTADGRNSNGAQVTDITFQCKHCNTYMGSDVIKCFVCGAVGDSLVPVNKEGFKPNEKEMTGVKQMTTFDDKKVQWTEDALQKLEEYPDGHVRRRAQARVEKNARVQSIKTVSVAFLDQILNERIVKKTEENKALENYMEDDEPKVTDFIWTEKANNRLELVPKGFMRDNTRSRVMAYAHSNDIKEITLEVCEAGIKDSVKMMEEAIANGATLEDFLPKKVDA